MSPTPARSSDPPGPARIAPARCPGGLVARTYSLGGDLLRETLVPQGGEEMAATFDALANLADPRARNGARVVVYDGDDVAWIADVGLRGRPL